MPNSSRRKQSKPQHVLNEEEEEDVKPGNHSVTSTHTSATGDQPTQEGQYGSKVAGSPFLWENGNGDAGNTDAYLPVTVPVPIEDENDESEPEDAESLGKGDGEQTSQSLPHDLSMKKPLTEAEASLSEKRDVIRVEEEAEGEKEENGLMPRYSPSSEQLGDREATSSPTDLHKYLGDKPFHCQKCGMNFTTSHSLQHHGCSTQHHTEPVEVNIAQQLGLSRKRPLDDSQPKHDDNQLYAPSTPAMESRSSRSPVLLLSDSPTNLSCSPSQSSIIDMASKRQKTSVATPQPSHSSSMVHSTSDIQGLNLKMAHVTDAASRVGTSVDGFDSQEVARACQVCAKTFPKPSDLKRHMMCHTGEKPFRCEYCHKPFRAKSSMHYHLKATHGLEIELSPGLEERFMRMKTRAHMNMLQRGNVMAYPYKDSIDIDDIEDDIKSIDSSSYNNLGINLDLKEPTHSQGLHSNTGIEEREAIDLSTSDKRRNRAQDIAEQQSEGEILIAANAPFRTNKISIQNETVVITRLDGFDIMNGENASIFKCYLCGKMFRRLSSMQCHLSLHFEKHVVSFECCFCNEVFQFKTHMRNHIRRQHKSQFDRNGRMAGREDDTTLQGAGGNDKSTGKKKASLYRCRFCSKTFHKKISLHKHVRLHYWNRNCFCRICGKSFQHYTSLQLHISRFHWKTGQKSNGSWLHGKFNFFNTKRFHLNTHDGVQKPDNCEPLDLIKSKPYQNDRNMSLPNTGVTVVLPQSPPIENGDLSDTGASHHSSENNWSESLSDNAVMEYDETGAEIKTAPKRSLMSFRRENSPRNKTSRKSTPTHIPPQNQSTSDNALPLNFVKTEPSPQQDSNNNESSSNHSDAAHRLSPDAKSSGSLHEALLPGYSLNATNHLIMAKALAAHQSLAQHLAHTSQSLIYPPNHLPPSLAAMTQMMSLPAMSVQVPSEARAGTSKSPSPASHSSSKSDTSPDDRDIKEPIRDGLVGYPRVQWGQQQGPKGPEWTFNMYCPPDTSHTDGRKVTSLSRTHSRLGIVHSPINRESICKPTTLMDGRTVYKCPFCSKEFVSFSDINRHMDFHEDIRPYKCQFCDYYARTNSQLKVHMMRHQGIREFCCKLCNYKGVTQSDLNRHMKSQIHMLKSRNACSYCGEGFVTPKNLEKHLDGNCIVKMQKLNGSLDIRLQESVA